LPTPGNIAPAPQRWIRVNAANLLTAGRFAAAAGWIALFVGRPESTIALGSIAVAASLSDLLDGRIARLLSASSGAGRWLDGVADVTFVLAVLGCEASRGAIPAYVPALIAASFTQYSADSLLRGGARRPIRSRIGHWGGVLNYALAIVLSFAPPPNPPGAIVRSCAPLLALYYVAAILERVIMYFR